MTSSQLVLGLCIVVLVVIGIPMSIYILMNNPYKVDRDE